MEHNITLNETYVNMDCYGWEGKCSCGFEVFEWTQTKCAKKIQRHKLEEEYHLEESDITNHFYELLEQVEAERRGLV